MRTPEYRKNFRDAAHELEARIDEILMTDYLLLRRAEKDNLLRYDAKYITESDNQVSLLKTKINYQDQELISDLDDYQKNFHELVNIQNLINTDIETMRGNVHKIEPIIISLQDQAEKEFQKTKIQIQNQINLKY